MTKLVYALTDFDDVLINVCFSVEKLLEAAAEAEGVPLSEVRYNKARNTIEVLEYQDEHAEDWYPVFRANLYED